MGSETSSSIERPSYLVRRSSVLPAVSLSLTVMAWFYAPGHLFYYVAAFLRPLFAQYTRAACGSTIPLAATVFGLWAISIGRRVCGTAWFIIAIISILVSGNLVAANFYVSSALPHLAPSFWTRASGAVGATPGKRRLPQISGWKPTVVLKIMRRNTFLPSGPGPRPRLGTGVAWTQGGYAVASPTRSFGLVAWQRPLSPQSHIATIPYRSGGFVGTASPTGLIARKHSIGVGYFWKGRHGANPRLDVDWYSRKGLKFLHFYRIVLRGVRNAGIQLVAPPDGNWFATIPAVAAKGAQSRIRIWNTQNGKPLPVHFPLLRQRHNSAFCNSGALGWVDGSEQLYLARLGSQPGGRAVVRQMVLGRGPLRCGAMSPDGKRLLLISRTNRYFPGRVTIIMAPTSGTGEMEVMRYLRTGGSIAAPVFSPDSHFAAFALIAVKGPIFRGIDLILVRARGLRVVHWAHIPMVQLPRALSFSPDGRQVALVTDHQIFIFNTSGSQKGLSLAGLPLSGTRRIPLPQQSRALPPRPRHTKR